MGIFSDYAMKYYEAGYSVIPVIRETKKPVIDEWSKYSETMPTYEEIEEWEKKYPDYNIGICLGSASKMICVDFDMTFGPAEEIENFLLNYLPPTPLAKKGKKGWTRFYKYNGETSTFWNKSKQRMIDFYSNGKQVVIPPSIHPETKQPYVWLFQDATEINPIDLPSLPSGFFDICNKLASDDHKKVLSMKEGRHDKIIAYGFAIIESQPSIEVLAEKLIEYDKRVNQECQYFLDRKYFKKSQSENAMEIARKVEKSVARIFEKKRNVIGWKVGQDAPIVDIDMAIELSPGFYETQIDEKTGSIKLIPDYVGMGNVLSSNGIYKSTDGGDYVFSKGYWHRISEKKKNNLVLRMNRMLSVPSHYKGFVTEIDARCHCENLSNEITGFVNLANGVLDTNTWSLLPHSQKFDFRHKSNTSFDLKAECPQWMTFLNTVMDGDFERIACLQQMVGYILMGGKPFLQKAFVLFGDGRNGKSVFLKVLRELIGADACSSLSLKAFSERFETVMLDGKLCNISSDEGDDFRISTGAFKLAVSGESLLVQQKGQPAFSIDVNARFIFSCNKFPYFGERSHALLDRLIVIPFDRMFLDQDKDPHLDDKLLKELPGVLNWAIKGAQEVVKNQSIISPRQSVLAKEEMTEDVDPLLNWIEENLVFEGLDTSTSVSELYEHFRKCSSDDGGGKFSKVGFSRELRKHVRKKYIESSGGKLPKELSREVRSGKTRHIIGVKFSLSSRKFDKISYIFGK